MRENKFRAWITEDHEHFETENEKPYMEYGFAFEDYMTINEELAAMQEHGSILMQNTGLKDKNQKEIFEGDIGFDNHSENDGIVKFKEGKFVYEWDNVCEDLCEVNKDIEVIGNVFEHRRLVGGREK